MSNKALLQQAKTTKVETDHSQVKKGSFAKIPEEGKCPARLIGYVELGTHAQPEYKGQAKQPELEVQLTFECLGKNNIDEFEIEGKKIRRGRIIRPLPMTMKLNERAKFYKLFKSMDNDRGLDHMSKMLDEIFYLHISHGVSKNTDNKYAKIDAILPPFVDVTDEDGTVTGTKDVSESQPPAGYDLQLFIIERPTFEQWKSIEIEGTYTKKSKDADGKEVEEETSKNFIQGKIKDSLDWEGSAMQALLLDLGSESKEEVQEVEKKSTEKKEPETKEAPAEKDATKVEETDDELMAELGM